ncbi:LrgB family protein [Paenibacillus sp. NPDC058174]|uniref:LrgB family protein n=1 Tax=Paenibacillus sp. NPDC058174 TaxID=3346366 RepID=UPI0036D78841
MMEAALWLLATIAVYAGAKRLYRMYPKLWLTPLLVTPAIIIIAIELLGVPFKQYNNGAGVLTDMIEPATVALAVLLYKHLDVLKKNALLIAVSVSSGAIAAIVTSAGLARLLGLNAQMMETLAPRSATTPIALAVSDMLGGLPTITAVATLITGLLGMIVGPLVVRLCRIRNPIARGVLFGTSAHSAGVSKAFEYGPVTGSVAGIAMLLTAFVTLCAAPWLVSLFV